MSNIVRNIGPAIQKRRAELGISLEEVARRASCTKSHVWELEKGRSVNPTITMLLAVASALNTNINALLGTDISQPTLSDDELELIHHHRRIFARFQSSKSASGDEITQIAINLDCEPDIDSILHTIGEIQADLEIAKEAA